MVQLAVVIPFYQRQAGLLRRAVTSVLAQEALGDAVVAVVDDGSPVGAAAEIGDMMGGGRILFRRQPNGGVAAARNAALDLLPPGTTHVAFLDSDDAYAPGHLGRVRAAFAAGADLFFTDFRRPDEALTCFEGFGFGRRSRVLDDGLDLHWFLGTPMDLLMKDTPCATNTAAYRFAGREGVRFDTRFRRACEDRLFFARLTGPGDRIAFSRTPGISCGQGVNIYAASGWGTPEALERVVDTARFHAILAREFPLDPEQRRRNAEAIRGLDQEFAQNLIVCLGKTGRLPAAAAAAHLRLRPLGLPAALGPALGEVLKRRRAVACRMRFGSRAALPIVPLQVI